MQFLMVSQAQVGEQYEGNLKMPRKSWIMYTMLDKSVCINIKLGYEVYIIVL